MNPQQKTNSKKKRVQVTIEISEHFLRLLKAQVGLNNWSNMAEPYPRGGHTPAAALAVVVLAEARGAFPEQVHALTPMEWRPDIEAISAQRKVLLPQDERKGKGRK